MKSEPPSIRIILRSETSSRPSTKLLRQAVQAVAGERAWQGTLNVLFATDDRLRELNRTFRGIDEPTDVLTFGPDDWQPNHLGDIAISVETAKRQADFRGIRLREELAFLGLHGALHLAGLEDETEQQRQAMWIEMGRVALHVGLPDPGTWHSVHAGAAS